MSRRTSRRASTPEGAPGSAPADGPHTAIARARLRSWARRQHWPAYLYLLPGAVFYALFVLRPLLTTAWVSLFDWDGLTLGRWAGWDNYTALLRDPVLRDALAHSLIFIVFYALLPVAVGLALTGLMTRVRVRGLSFFRAVLFVPQVLSPVVIAVSWRWIYDVEGPVNELLRALGPDGLARSWLGDHRTALPAVGLIGTWIMYGLCLVLFLTGAGRVPRELFEAARLDGAGPVREFRAVVLPALRGEIALALVLTVTQALRNFDIVWNTTTGGPGHSTTVPSVFVYQGAFVTRRVGAAAATGIALTVLTLLVCAVILRVTRERSR
ncbi:carbohydrate ABC transporter permease [Streptomyces sp. URMC 123]|uniref:carbohydrate ABC transporter permease n=1 Tax=Streptomyces sp. URMC 123 TaxID=3423403 RepID=UPI003F19445C